MKKKVREAKRTYLKQLTLMRVRKRGMYTGRMDMDSRFANVYLCPPGYLIIFIRKWLLPVPGNRPGQRIRF